MKRKELKELAAYLQGYADANENEKIGQAAKFINGISPFICGQGFACNGGDNCSSDHK